MDLYKNAIIMKVLSRLLCLVLCLPLLVMGQEKITWDKDGKEMVLIPAGSFEMGDHHDRQYEQCLTSTHSGTGRVLYGCE